MRVLSTSVTIAFWAVFLACNASAIAGPSECQEAVSEYKSARSDIFDTMQRYTQCVSSNDGHDDCSTEFQALKSAQDDFEEAVSRYESECS